MLIIFYRHELDKNVNKTTAATVKSNRKLSMHSINLLSSSCSSDEDDGHDCDDEEDAIKYCTETENNVSILTNENLSLLNSTMNRNDSANKNDFDSNESANSTHTSVDSKILSANLKRKKVMRANKARLKSQDNENNKDFARVCALFLIRNFFFNNLCQNFIIFEGAIIKFKCS